MGKSCVFPLIAVSYLTAFTPRHTSLMSPTIRAATTSDIPAVMQIAREHDLGGKDAERAKREGFLVSAFPAEVYHRLLTHLRVAELDGEIAGFTLTFSSGELPPEVHDEHRIISVVGDDPYFLIKQVGVAIRFQKRGVGRAMYQDLIDGLRVPCFAPIVLVPTHRNVLSIKFHEALGFRQVETLKNERGQDKSGLWCKFPD